MNIILRKALISEKSMKATAQSVFTFLVDQKSTRDQVARAVIDQFAVEVVSVKIANSKEGQRRQRSRKGYFVVSGVKKAMVELKKGQKIALFETEADKTEAEVTTAESKPKEKKSLLKGTTVKIEKTAKKKETTNKKGKK